jgi:hypothetical protein
MDEGDDEGEEGEEEESKFFEGAVLCEVGEHWVDKEDLLPNFADCYECVTVKEYAEHQGISLEKAQRICDGEEGEEEGEDEGEDDEASNDEASREEEERMRMLEREEEEEREAEEAEENYEEWMDLARGYPD